MEKYEKSRRYEYRFTDAEKENLQTVLKGYPPEKVQRCIGHLEFYCQDVKAILEYPKNNDMRRDRKTAINTLNKALDLLKDMRLGYGDGTFVMNWNRSLLQLRADREAISRREYPPEDTFTYIFNAAPKAIAALEGIVEAIEEQTANEEKSGRGRPEADALGIARTVADVLHKHLDITPTTYPEGVFAIILRICLEAIGLPCADPSRAVRQTVDSFQIR